MIVARSHEMSDWLSWIVGRFGDDYTAVIESGGVYSASHFDSLSDALEWVQK